MKLTVHHQNLRCRESLDPMVEKGVRALQTLLPIREARVSLGFHSHENPPFTARVHLITPGRELVDERRHHSAHAAIERVIMDLETRIRRLLRDRRRLSNVPREAPLVPPRRHGAP